MEFAKYYDVTSVMNKLIKEEKLTSYENGYCLKLYICSDTHDFWVSRIIKGYNSEFEKDEDKWLVERNKINKYDFCEFIKKSKNDDSQITDRYTRDYYIDKCFSTDEIIEHVILMDDSLGLEGWDNCECDSFEQAEEVVDGGFGIIKVKL